MEQKIFNVACLLCILSAVAFAYSGEVANISSPWTDCGRDFACAQEISGVEFDISLPEFEIRAMPNMTEIHTSNNNQRIILRKSLLLPDNYDNSGDFNSYKQTEPAEFNRNVILRKNDDLIYVMYFTQNGYRYSLSCPEGISAKQAQHYYTLMTK